MSIIGGALPPPPNLNIGGAGAPPPPAPPAPTPLLYSSETTYYAKMILGSMYPSPQRNIEFFSISVLLSVLFFDI